MVVRIPRLLFWREALVIYNLESYIDVKKTVFYKTYYDSGVYTVSDLWLNLDNVESFEAIRNKRKSIFLHGLGLDIQYLT